MRGRAAADHAPALIRGSGGRQGLVAHPPGMSYRRSFFMVLISADWLVMMESAICLAGS